MFAVLATCPRPGGCAVPGLGVGGSVILVTLPVAQGAPGGIRTPDHQIRSLPLYPLSYRRTPTPQIIAQGYWLGKQMRTVATFLDVETAHRTLPHLLGLPP